MSLCGETEPWFLMKNRSFLHCSCVVSTVFTIVLASSVLVQTQAPRRTSRTTREPGPTRKTVNNQPPKVSATVSLACGQAPLSISFSAVGSDPEGSEISYQWFFGDGGEASGAKVSYTFQSPGIYGSKIVVTDSKGATAEATLVITVSVSTPLGTGMRYYVSTNGSDTNPGTEALPFKTIQKAADIVNPGDAVIVEDGVYTMETPNPSCSRFTAVVCLTRGGNSNNMVVFKSRNKWGAKIDGQNNRVQNGFRFASPNASYIRVEGFDVYGAGNDGSSAGFDVFNGSHHVEIVGNHIHDIGRLCTNTTNGQVGIYIAQDNVLIEGNVIHDIGRFKPGENGCNPTNNFWQNHDHGIYHSRGNDVTIQNNIFYLLQRGWGVQAYPSSRTRATIVHNTFYGPNPDQPGQIVIDGSGMTDSVIANNIFHQPNTAAMYVRISSLTNVLVSNNLTTAGKLTDRTPAPGFVMTNNMISTDPKLADPTLFNFKLLPGSPAIDAGMSVPAVVKDFGGCPRPQGNSHDIGAYEYTAGSSQTARYATGLRTGNYKEVTTNVR